MLINTLSCKCFVFLSALRPILARIEDTRICRYAWTLGKPVPLLPAISELYKLETQWLSRGASDYFLRTIVRSTRFSHMTDRRLCLVLQTRLAIPSPQSACSLHHCQKHTCSSTRVFASGFLQADISAYPCL